VKEAYEMDKFGFECERMDAESNATSISFFEQKVSCSLKFELLHEFIDRSNEFIMIMLQYISIHNFFYFYCSLDSLHVRLALQRM
jgi:hypothetical protein